MNKKIINKKFSYNRLIVLIGHMGCGKSTIGKILAKNLKLKFYDSDRIIENTQKKSINRIFEEKGENYFRKLEKKILVNILSKNDAVIAIGGGAILEKKTRDLIFKKTISIFLNVDIEVLVKRLKKNNKRPLLKNVDIKEKILSLDNKRSKFYKKADIEIQNINNIDQSIKRLKELIFYYS